MSRFDRFRTEQIRTEREKLFSHAKPENLACYRLSLVVLFISNQIKDIWLAFCAAYIVRMRPGGQMMPFLKILLPNKIEAK